MGLTLHQLGLPFHILEAVKDPKPMGVGINLQPPAVRELFALGLEPALDRIGVRTQDYGFYTKTGTEIWTEPRGHHAGYHWPQVSVHRGQLQMALLDAVLTRCGPDSVSFGCRVDHYEASSGDITVHHTTGCRSTSRRSSMLIGADGIHSKVRAQMYPDEGPPVWSGAIMWRATSKAKPFLSGRSMVLIGNDYQRFVAYPISDPDPKTGLSVINWIAERRVDPSQTTAKEDWTRRVRADRFAHDFRDWRFEWIDVPQLIETATEIFEYPMIDRNPVDSWTDNAVTLVGDAAHATFPVGSSGASQAIIDVRTLGAAIARLGPGRDAALAYEAKVLPKANAVTLANRSKGGPDAIMQMAEDRCGGDFTRLEQVLPMAERKAHADRFKQLAGIGVEDTNNRPPILDL